MKSEEIIKKIDSLPRTEMAAYLTELKAMMLNGKLDPMELATALEYICHKALAENGQATNAN